VALYGSSVTLVFTSTTAPYPHALLLYHFYAAHKSSKFTNGEIAVANILVVSGSITMAETHDGNKIYMYYKAQD
jgi:hypothetical protein